MLPFNCNFFSVNNFVQTNVSSWLLWVDNITLHVIGDLVWGHWCFSRQAMEKPSSVGINVANWKYRKLTARMKKCVSLTPLKLAKYWTASVKWWIDRWSDCDNLHLWHLQNIIRYMCWINAINCHNKILHYFKKHWLNLNMISFFTVIWY
jgi:hypothetical protein